MQRKCGHPAKFTDKIRNVSLIFFHLLQAKPPSLQKNTLTPCVPATKRPPQGVTVHVRESRAFQTALWKPHTSGLPATWASVPIKKSWGFGGCEHCKTTERHSFDSLPLFGARQDRSQRKAETNRPSRCRKANVRALWHTCLQKLHQRAKVERGNSSVPRWPTAPPKKPNSPPQGPR